MKKIGILGSTGSIGTQTLEIIDIHPSLEVVAISANRSVEKVFAQCIKYHPKCVAMMDETSAEELRKRLKDGNIDDVQVFQGMDGLIQVATHEEVEVLVTAVVGMIGLLPTIEGIKSGKTIALANKETLVTAGELIMPLAKQYDVDIIPVDSEHSAIFQSLAGSDYNKIEKVILTASGGPFRGYTKEQLQHVSLEQALKHPNWDMGAKITIDSSTLMNKGLEVIEAKWLFDVEPEAIDVVVHPQSIIHSMVQFVDGSVIGQMGLPDMKLPIQYAIFHGERESTPFPRLNLASIGSLTFEEPNIDVFPCLKLAYEALALGKEMPTVLNAANEFLVSKFLERKIQYFELPIIIQETMQVYYEQEFDADKPLTIDLILATEQWTKNYIESR